MAPRAGYCSAGLGRQKGKSLVAVIELPDGRGGGFYAQVHEGYGLGSVGYRFRPSHDSISDATSWRSFVAALTERGFIPYGDKKTSVVKAAGGAEGGISVFRRTIGSRSARWNGGSVLRSSCRGRGNKFKTREELSGTEIAHSRKDERNHCAASEAEVGFSRGADKRNTAKKGAKCFGGRGTHRCVFNMSVLRGD